MVDAGCPTAPGSRRGPPIPLKGSSLTVRSSLQTLHRGDLVEMATMSGPVDDFLEKACGASSTSSFRWYRVRQDDLAQRHVLIHSEDERI